MNRKAWTRKRKRKQRSLLRLVPCGERQERAVRVSEQSLGTTSISYIFTAAWRFCRACISAGESGSCGAFAAAGLVRGDRRSPHCWTFHREVSRFKNFSFASRRPCSAHPPLHDSYAPLCRTDACRTEPSHGLLVLDLAAAIVLRLNRHLLICGSFWNILCLSLSWHVPIVLDDLSASFLCLLVENFLVCCFLTW